MEAAIMVYAYIAFDLVYFSYRIDQSLYSKVALLSHPISDTLVQKKKKKKHPPGLSRQIKLPTTALRIALPEPLPLPHKRNRLSSISGVGGRLSLSDS